MNSASKLFKNTLLLAAGSIVLRLCALCFQSYLAAKVGAQQLGFFGIISSVGVVFATIAISGVRFGVTRLVSQECSMGNEYPRRLMRCAFLYGASFGAVSGFAMYFSANLLSAYWVMDLSAGEPLRLMALSMPLISIGAAVEGYFTAKQKVFRLVSVEVMSQLVRVIFVAVCFSLSTGNVSFSTMILAAGAFVGEAVLSISMLLMYFFEIFRKKEQSCEKNNLSRLAKTALPLAVSAYMRTGLSSLGQIIIPRGLRKAGMGFANAFTTYGIITQMALPVIMFPAALLNALGEVLVPRLTSSQVKGQKIGISYIVNRALRIGIIFSFGIMGIMLFYSDALGKSFYSSTEAGKYIRIFAPLLPVIYIDCVTDGCLKGLGQQVHSMMYNVMEGMLNVVLLYILLPKAAVAGYIAVMYIKEIFNAVLSIRRLSKVTCVDKNIFAFICVLLSSYLAYVFGNIVVPDSGLVIAVSLYLLFYVALLYVMSTVTRDDIKWTLSLFKNDDKENIAKKPFGGVDKTAMHW